MSSNSNGCNKCKENKPCTCKKPKQICYTDGCPEKIDSACVVYKPKGGKSYLSCFLGLPAKSSSEKIFETLDEKLCNLFSIQVSACVKTMLNIKEFADLKSTVVALLDYVCELKDTKVKVSASDSSSGFLNDKLVVGECLTKKILTDPEGRQRLEISIDYQCLAGKLPTCIEVDCCGNGAPFSISSPIFSVCGTNVVTLTATNCLETVTWYKNNIQVGTGTTYTGTAGSYYATCGTSTSNTVVITNSGACSTFNASRTGTFYKVCPATCTSVPVSFTKTYSGATQAAADALRDGDTNFNSDGQAHANLAGSCINCGTCTQVWSAVLPVSIFCGQALNTMLGINDRDTCKKYILENNQCDTTTRWVEYTGSNSDGSTCPGCVPSSFSVTKTVSFTRNNCDSGCTAGTYSFSRTYTSLVSLAAAETLRDNDAAQFAIDGQAAANNPANAACTNCPNVCIPTGVVLCSSNSSNITYTDSCGGILGTIALNDLQYTCSSTSGIATIAVSNTQTNGFVANDYLIEYAITGINGAVPPTQTYQANNQFTGLAHNTTYTVSMRVTRGGQICYLTKTLFIGECTSCNDPLGTISIVTSSSSVCGNNSVVLTATSSNCNIIEWYRVNPATADLFIGTGASITVSPTMTSVYEARCFNCNFGHVASNTVTISYLTDCPGACALNITSAGNLPNTERTVYFTGATPFTDYSYSTDGGNSWNPLTASQLTETTPGAHTYCVRKNNDVSCSDCVSFTVNSTCIEISTLQINQI